MKEYNYPKEFEEIWSQIPGRGTGNPKEIGYKLFLRMKTRSEDIMKTLEVEYCERCEVIHQKGYGCPCCSDE